MISWMPLNSVCVAPGRPFEARVEVHQHPPLGLFGRDAPPGLEDARAHVRPLPDVRHDLRVRLGGERVAEHQPERLQPQPLELVEIQPCRVLAARPSRACARGGVSIAMPTMLALGRVRCSSRRATAPRRLKLYNHQRRAGRVIAIYGEALSALTVKNTLDIPSSWLRALVLALIVLAWLALLVLLLWVLSHFTKTILMVVLAAVLAFAFTPLANFFGRWTPRPVAIALAYIVGVASHLRLWRVRRGDGRCAGHHAGRQRARLRAAGAGAAAPHRGARGAHSAFSRAGSATRKRRSSASCRWPRARSRAT